MWLTKLFTAVMVVLAGLVPTSCTTAKKPAAQQHAPAMTSATSPESLNDQNLGELELTNHYETCVNLGAGKSCTIKPTLLDHRNLQLTMALESKSASGSLKGLSVVQIVTISGQPFEVAVGDMNLTLTPKLAAE